LPLNPFDDPRLAGQYDDWYSGPGRYADRCEKALLARLLADFAGCASLLEVGCGTGHFTRWFAEQGLTATGLDISKTMLAEAARRNGVSYVLGDAQALPFPAASLDLAAMITTLEFLPDPRAALVEAVRVTRQGLLLGVLNRWSLAAARRRRSSSTVWRAAHFFSVSELCRLVHRAAGSRLQGIRWRTTLWPLPVAASLRLPLGGFIGLAARLKAA
jgi:ubiquinone/menaquinone biosynthesis C-methylase UbiE